MSDAPPRAISHQEAIVRALVKLFELSVADLEAVQRGGSRAVEKLLRSYHYWASEYGTGVCPYDHPKLGYFRMTPSAAAHDGSTKDRHCEHVVPIRWIRETMMVEHRKTDQPLRDEYIQSAKLAIEAGFDEYIQSLMDINEIVVVTKVQAKLLDKCYPSRMPNDWSMADSSLARLKGCLPPQELLLIGEALVGRARGAV